MNTTVKLHHYCQNIKEGYLADVIEMYEVLGLRVVYTPPKKDFAMVGSDNLDFSIQVTQVDDEPIPDLDVKRRTHVAFLSDDPMSAIKKVEEWANSKNIRFRDSG